jgi:hypothetical protein
MILPSDFTDIIVKSLAPEVKEILQHFDGTTCVAGGFCRDTMTGREPKDVDIFSEDARVAKLAIERFGWATALYSQKTTANAVSFTPVLNVESKPDVQFITRTYYTCPTELIESFDFSVCQVAVYWDQKWVGVCTELFWQDIFGEKATYTLPTRDEDPGGSLLRMVKFVGKGYKVTENDIANVTGRFYAQLSGEPEEAAREKVKKTFRRIGYAGKQNLDAGREDQGREI